MGADYDVTQRLRLAPTRLLAGCFLDLRHDIRDTIVVVATGRSGSTWVAEIVNRHNEYRLVFEPFRGDRVRKARPFRRGHYIDPLDQQHPLARTIDELLAGRVRSWWTDRPNNRRIATRRIVKEIRITNLVPWIHARHPGLRIVYAVRDPVAVATSWLELAWPDDLDELLSQEALLACFPDARAEIDRVAGRADPFERNVLRWCLENAIPLKADLPGVHRVRYEALRDEPARELPRLFAYLGADAEGSDAAVRKPSRTAGFPRRASFRPTAAQRARARELLELFELTEAVAAED